MKIIKKSLLLIILITSFAYAEKNLSNQYVQANNTFAFDLYKKLNNEKTFCFSPYSISSCLSMVYLGANDTTENEMKKVLSFNFEQMKLPLIYKSLTKKISDNTCFTIANSLWIDYSTHIMTHYNNSLKNYFDSEMKKISFSSPAIAANEINGWVEENTNHKIKDIISPSALDPYTRMILVNAIYFKNDWQMPFFSENTAKENFYSKNSSSKVDMMNQIDRFSYYENEFMQSISMPFKNNKFSFMVLLPKKNYSISTVEEKLNYETFNSWMNSFSIQKVNLSIPKFKLSFNTELSYALKSMGMITPFSMKADFSLIDGTKNLYLSKVLHEAYFDMNENGVEAAAATAAIISFKGSYSRPDDLPIRFDANHPFIYMIVEKNTNTILFMGKFDK